MPTFALDTATPSPSLALAHGGELLAELWVAGEPGSGRRVLELAHQLLGAAGVAVDAVDGVVVGIGPGGFTGLRIGIATALGLGQALGVEVTGASSLEALALGLADLTGRGRVVAPVLDARRGELFAAAYRAGGADVLEELVAPRALAPGALAAELKALVPTGGRVLVGGPGVTTSTGALADGHLEVLPSTHPAARVRAGDLLRRVAAGAGRPARPEYARLPDAEVNRRWAPTR